MPPKIDVKSYATQFEWDETKNRTNIRKHGFAFTDARTMFRGILLVHADQRRNYGEDRRIGIGTLRGRVAVVVFTERGLETIRIISLRTANHEERKQYEKALRNGLEAH